MTRNRRQPPRALLRPVSLMAGEKNTGRMIDAPLDVAFVPAPRIDTAAPLLRGSDVAALLGISERTLRRLIRAGEIPFVQLGRSVRFRRIDVDHYLLNKIMGIKLHAGFMRPKQE